MIVCRADLDVDPLADGCRRIVFNLNDVLIDGCFRTPAGGYLNSRDAGDLGRGEIENLVGKGEGTSCLDGHRGRLAENADRERLGGVHFHADTLRQAALVCVARRERNLDLCRFGDHFRSGQLDDSLVVDIVYLA